MLNIAERGMCGVRVSYVKAPSQSQSAVFVAKPLGAHAHCRLLSQVGVCKKTLAHCRLSGSQPMR